MAVLLYLTAALISFTMDRNIVAIEMTAGITVAMMVTKLVHRHGEIPPAIA